VFYEENGVEMSNERTGQAAYDIYQSITTLHRKFGPQPKNRSVSVYDIQHYLSSGATKAEIMAWALSGIAKGQMKVILGVKDDKVD